MQSEFLSWYWWLSVVVVGLLINLVSPYVKPALDALFAFLSTRSLMQQIKQAEEEMARLDEYAKSDKAILVLGFTGLFGLLALASLMAVMIIAIQRASDLLIALEILILVLVSAISIYFAGLFQQISDYPRTREKIEQQIAKLKYKL